MLYVLSFVFISQVPNSNVDKIVQEYLIDQFYRSKLSDQSGCPIQPGDWYNLECA